MNPIDQMIPTRIKIWVTPEDVAPAYFEENLVRELPLELAQVDENATIFQSKEQLAPYNVSFNTQQKIIVELKEKEILLLTEVELAFGDANVFITVEDNENEIYKVISQENQLLHQLGQSKITEEYNAYIVALVQHTDKQNNFKINPWTIEKNGNKNFRITSLEIDKVPINRVYGTTEHQKKIPISFDLNPNEKQIPIILAPISTEHDVKMWDITRDPEKAIELERIKKLIKLESDGKNSLDNIDSSLLPAVSRNALQKVIQISIAADSSFEGFAAGTKVSGIEIERITKLSTDIAVNFIIQNTMLKSSPNIRDSQEWILFTQWLWASSHAIAMPSWMLPSGKSEQNKIVLPFYIDISIASAATWSPEGDVPLSDIKFNVRSLYYDINKTDPNNIKFTLKPSMNKHLNSMYAFRTPEPYIFPELPREIKAKNENMNVNVRIFSESSQVKKYLFWIKGNEQTLEKLLTKTSYGGVEVVQKTLRYDWHYDGRYQWKNSWIFSVNGAKSKNPEWITITNKQDQRFLEIIKHTTGIPDGYAPVQMQIKQSYHESTTSARGHGAPQSARLEVLLTIDNTPSLPEITEIIENPVLDADRFLDKMQQLSGTGKLEFDISATKENIPYIYIKGWLVAHYKATISYEDADGNTQTIERHGWWSQANDNSITEFKIAVNQKINI